MAAAPPRTESALDERIYRALKRAYGRDCWTMKTHKAAGGTPGLPDRIYVIRGHVLFWEQKLPGRRNRDHLGHQGKVQRDIARAGGDVYVVTSVEQALDIVAGTVGQTTIDDHLHPDGRDGDRRGT